MNLVSIYERPDRHELLWRLLSERDPEVNISHRGMPSWDEHVAFVESKPYEAWYFICNEDDGETLGACYLTQIGEIGIFLFRMHQGYGSGPCVVEELMKLHGERRYLANVALMNERSRNLFVTLGFKPIQMTYERLPSRP